MSARGSSDALALALLGIGAAAGVGVLAWWFLRSRDEGADVTDLASTWLMERSRADGITQPKILAFLDELEARGLLFMGERYRVMVGRDGGVRTPADQLRLYAKGRAQAPDGTWRVVDQGAVVTNIKDATGKHPQGKAVDLWVVIDGKPLLFPKDAPGSTSGERDAFFNAIYSALGQYGELFGLKWGGRWTSLVDRPHFEVA